MSNTTIQNKESLSALADGEASEFEVRKLIRLAAEDSELRATWQRYHVVSSSLRSEQQATPNLELCDSIFAAIEQEPAHGSSVIKRVWQPISRFAIAASVATIAVIGVQQYSKPDVSQAPVAATSSEQVTAPVQFPSAFTVPRVPVRAVSASNVSDNYTQSKPVVVLRKVEPLNEADQRQVELYLNSLMQRHTENSATIGSQGVLPFARMPNTNTEQP